VRLLCGMGARSLLIREESGMVVVPVIKNIFYKNFSRKKAKGFGRKEFLMFHFASFLLCVDYTTC
jgi:hypothetical protein